jgi:transketolase
MMLIAEENPEVLAMTADLSDTTRLTQLRKKYPDRFFNVGVAEQNLVGAGVGLSMAGYTVFCTSFAPFISMRSCEQVRTDAGYMNANVKLLGADAGLAMGTLGNTHYAIEDISVIRAFPNLRILSPADNFSVVKAVIAASESYGPIYIRLTGGKNVPVVYENDYDFEIGKAIWLREGKDFTFIATGSMVSQAIKASEILEKKGISAGVCDMHTIKPIDEAAIRKAGKVGMIVTVEEHSVIGGLGAAVCEVAAEDGYVVRRIGLPDLFGPIGTYQDQMLRYGLTAEQIAEKAEDYFTGGSK